MRRHKHSCILKERERETHILPSRLFFVLWGVQFFVPQGYLCVTKHLNNTDQRHRVSDACVYVLLLEHFLRFPHDSSHFLLELRSIVSPFLGRIHVGWGIDARR